MIRNWYSKSIEFLTVPEFQPPVRLVEHLLQVSRAAESGQHPVHVLHLAGVLYAHQGPVAGGRRFRGRGLELKTGKRAKYLITGLES